MSGSRFREQLRIASLVVIDTVTYASVVVAVITVLALTLGIATGGGFLRGKYILFILGFILMAYSVIRLWPSKPETANDAEADQFHGSETPTYSTVADQTRFQTFVRALPPLRWVAVPPSNWRLSPPTKLFVSSLGVLFVSYLMETWFGIV
ncbi:hypothetical protein ACLI4Y_15315 [Natrialbaceae archaeon A-CW3]